VSPGDHTETVRSTRNHRESRERSKAPRSVSGGSSQEKRLGTEATRGEATRGVSTRSPRRSDRSERRFPTAQVFDRSSEGVAGRVRTGEDDVEYVMLGPSWLERILSVGIAVVIAVAVSVGIGKVLYGGHSTQTPTRETASTRATTTARATTPARVTTPKGIASVLASDLTHGDYKAVCEYVDPSQRANCNKIEAAAQPIIGMVGGMPLIKISLAHTILAGNRALAIFSGKICSYAVNVSVTTTTSSHSDASTKGVVSTNSGATSCKSLPTIPVPRTLSAFNKAYSQAIKDNNHVVMAFVKTNGHWYVVFP